MEPRELRTAFSGADGIGGGGIGGSGCGDTEATRSATATGSLGNANSEIKSEVSFAPVAQSSGGNAIPQTFPGFKFEANLKQFAYGSRALHPHDAALRGEGRLPYEGFPA